MQLANEYLKRFFGYSTFRGNQEEVINTIVSGQDCLVIMPTGGGKSVCFQIPALMLEGVTIVVSPLIALMKDQVDGLKANGIAAEYINSSISATDELVILEKAHKGEIKLLYVSPEKLLTRKIFDYMKNTMISLIAIDEAHCISSWGHDFRPEYAKMGYLKDQFPEVPIIALTATADRVTREDIVKRMNLKNHKLFISSFDRPNLSLSVRPGRQVFKQIETFIAKNKGLPGIVYCLSRKSCDELAEKLSTKGHDVKSYHAGMAAKDRAKVQEDFINDNITIICATIAFGMGIDKSNIRWVLHHNLPKNIDGFYQEIGRAGRDGLKGETVLFYSYRDAMILNSFIDKVPNENQQLVQRSKLDRMVEYAESLTCRRKTLLSYFGEIREKNCGNCDVCKNPPKRFDGTVHAQKALSAVIRSKGVASGMLIDILRGSQKKEIFENGFEKIKTYGKGMETSFFHWQFIIRQLVQEGFLEMHIDNHNKLSVSSLGEEVLFAKRKVELVEPTVYDEINSEKVVLDKPKSKSQEFNETLFEKLRELRKTIANRENVPPYVVFTDASLNEMVEKRPVSPFEFKDISGVGEHKFEKYGEDFINEILNFIQESGSGPNSPSSNTFLVTYAMLKEGKSIPQIVAERGLKDVTIYSHIAKLMEDGKDIDHLQYMTVDEMDKILDAIYVTGEQETLKPLFVFLKEEISYGKIRIGLALYKKQKS